MMTRLASLAILLAFTACGSKDGDGGAAAVKLTQADVDAVNAKVPADLKDKVVFELRTAKDKRGRKEETTTFIAPKGWKDGFTPGAIEPEKSGWPADEDGFSLSKTSMWVSTTCDGKCEAKDWEKSADKHHFSQYTSGETKGKVLKDEKGDGVRTLVFQGETTTTTTKTENGESSSTTGSDSITIIRARWSKSASKYQMCRAELGKNAASLVDAFVQACDKFSVVEG